MPRSPSISLAIQNGATTEKSNNSELDFLLNTRQFARVGQSLATIRTALRQAYSERMPAESISCLVDGSDGDTHLNQQQTSALPSEDGLTSWIGCS